MDTLKAYPEITYHTSSIRPLYTAQLDSPVGIATRNRLNGPGNESRWVRDFPHPSSAALSSNEPPAQSVPGLFPGLKRWERDFDHSPQSSAEVKEEVELYLYFPSGSSWPVVE